MPLVAPSVGPNTAASARAVAKALGFSETGQPRDRAASRTLIAKALGYHEIADGAMSHSAIATIVNKVVADHVIQFVSPPRAPYECEWAAPAWTIPTTYRIERRHGADSETVGDWEVLAEDNATTYYDDTASGLSDYVEYRVTPKTAAGNAPPRVYSPLGPVIINKIATLPENEQHDFETNSPSDTVRWSVKSGSGTINPITGRYTPADVSAPETVVVALLLGNEEKDTDSFTVTPLIKATISNKIAYLRIGQTYDFDYQGGIGAVTWRVEPDSEHNDPTGTIDSDGIYTTPNSLPTGREATISLLDGGEVSESLTIALLPATAGKITNKIESLREGESYVFIAQLSASNSPTWRLTQGSGGSLGSNGSNLITFYSGDLDSDGTATLELLEFGVLSDSVTFRLVQDTRSYISNKISSIVVGDTYDFVAANVNGTLTWELRGLPADAGGSITKLNDSTARYTAPSGLREDGNRLLEEIRLIQNGAQVDWDEVGIVSEDFRPPNAPTFPDMNPNAYIAQWTLDNTGGGTLSHFTAKITEWSFQSSRVPNEPDVWTDLGALFEGRIELEADELSLAGSRYTWTGEWITNMKLNRYYSVEITAWSNVPHGNPVSSARSQFTSPLPRISNKISTLNSGVTHRFSADQAISSSGFTRWVLVSGPANEFVGIQSGRSRYWSYLARRTWQQGNAIVQVALQRQVGDSQITLDSNGFHLVAPLQPVATLNVFGASVFPTVIRPGQRLTISWFLRGYWDGAPTLDTVATTAPTQPFRSFNSRLTIVSSQITASSLDSTAVNGERRWNVTAVVQLASGISVGSFDAVAVAATVTVRGQGSSRRAGTSQTRTVRKQLRLRS